MGTKRSCVSHWFEQRSQTRSNCKCASPKLEQRSRTRIRAHTHVHQHEPQHVFKRYYTHVFKSLSFFFCFSAFFSSFLHSNFHTLFSFFTILHCSIFGHPPFFTTLNRRGCAEASRRLSPSALSISLIRSPYPPLPQPLIVFSQTLCFFKKILSLKLSLPCFSISVSDLFFSPPPTKALSDFFPLNSLLFPCSLLRFQLSTLSFFTFSVFSSFLHSPSLSGSFSTNPSNSQSLLYAHRILLSLSIFFCLCFSFSASPFLSSLSDSSSSTVMASSFLSLIPNTPSSLTLSVSSHSRPKTLLSLCFSFTLVFSSFPPSSLSSLVLQPYNEYSHLTLSSSSPFSIFYTLMKHNKTNQIPEKPPVLCSRHALSRSTSAHI